MRATSLALGDVIGPYRLISLLGEGGFARVWRARQELPLAREVALKLLKPGMASQDVLRHFQLEQETLVQMQHPGITQVLDAGLTDQGQPYLAMELVPEALPITEWCEKQRLPLAERLLLFLQLCRAVEHAHQRGVLHRDLKPNNVLVSAASGMAQVKVIDFGIAKVLSESAPEDAHAVGTTGCMSPEQAAGRDEVDTRSDVYALGVLLREMAGAAPPRDLHGIIRRCLEEDRARRYASASALAEDLQLFLQHRPVSARAPSLAYHLQRFMHRHRSLSAACVVAGLSLLGGVSLALHQARLAQEERQRSEEMTRVLVESWSKVTQLGSTSLTTMLRRVMEQVSAEGFSGRSNTRAQVLLKISEAAGIQSDFDLALEAADKALQLARAHPELGSGLLIDCLANQGNILSYSGKPEKALPILREALTLCEAEAGRLSHLSLPRQRMLGSALAKAGHTEAESLLREVVAHGPQAGFAEEEAEMIQARSDLAAALTQAGRIHEAEAMLNEAMAAARRGGDAKRDLLVRLHLRRGLLLVKQKRDEEAVLAYREAETEARQTKDPDASILFTLIYNRCLALMRLGRSQEVESVLETLFEDQVAYYQITHRQTRSTALTLARAYIAQQHWEKLDAHLDRVLDSVSPALHYPYHDTHIVSLAQHYEQVGDPARAEAWRARLSKNRPAAQRNMRSK